MADLLSDSSGSVADNEKHEESVTSEQIELKITDGIEQGQKAEVSYRAVDQ